MIPFKLKLLDTENEFNHFYNFIMRNTDHFTDYSTVVPSFDEVKEEFLLDVPPGIDIKNKEVYGVYMEEDLIGFLDILFNYPNSHICMIGYLVIDQSYRKHGIGQKVYNHAVAYAKGRDMRKIRLSVVKENEPAVGMWKKQGFETIDEEVTEYGTQLMMEISL
ncbi:GNAT family N-acetyltransferase [Salinicoccus carnicancri]|uniref:GNAT family N-acetyltransferase n=1 Tax=Salinicoccus carnicancri TaxID=558170 RepID=UPI000301C42C|nr:GNAT family N-acetyltransferase [Salinicoccus carnicancri]